MAESDPMLLALPCSVCGASGGVQCDAARHRWMGDILGNIEQKPGGWFPGMNPSQVAEDIRAYRAAVNRVWGAPERETIRPTKAEPQADGATAPNKIDMNVHTCSFDIVCAKGHRWCECGRPSHFNDQQAMEAIAARIDAGRGAETVRWVAIDEASDWDWTAFSDTVVATNVADVPANAPSKPAERVPSIGRALEQTSRPVTLVGALWRYQGRG